MRVQRLRYFVALLCGITCGTAQAEGGVYTQHACRMPDGTPARANGFKSTVGGLAELADRCASGEGLNITLPTTSEATAAWGSFDYTIPADLGVDAVSFRRLVVNIDGRDDSSARVYMGPGAGDSQDRCGWYGGFCGGDVWRDVTKNGPLESVAFKAYCETWGGCHGPRPGDGHVTIDNIAITLRDEHAPAFMEPPAGDLLTDRPVTATRSVDFTASDQGGGVFQAALIVDGEERPRVTLDDNGGACAVPFAHPVPCKTEVPGTLSLDTTEMKDGTHNVSVVVYDATGTNSVTHGPVPITVANHPDPPVTASSTTPEGSPAPAALGGVRLVMAPRFTKTSIRQRFGRTRTISGQVVDGRGAGVSGAKLYVFETWGGRERRVGVAVTGADGRFSFKLRPGANRQVSLRYGADPKLVPMWAAQVEVPGPLRLDATPDQLRNNETMALTASLGKGRRFEAGSADVAFQVRVGTQWRTFAKKAIGKDGIATVAHRFRVTYHRMTYRFRALLLPKRGFPFAAATAKSVAVRVN